MPRITFVEVDPEDTHLVTDTFPDATIISTPLSEADALKKCAGTEIFSGMVYSPIGETELKKLPNLKLICTRSVGFDHIDLHACTKRHITVCHVPDYGSHVIAEHVFALLLSAVRHIREADERVEHHEFDYHGLRGIALKGKTLGVIGTGKIGSCVCRIAHGFGMPILAYDIYPNTQLEQYGLRYTDLEDVLSQSDIITLHTPATPDTEHMINRETILHMKDGVILVNTARGSLIDTPAIVDALRSGKMQYALLDVLEHEKSVQEDAKLIALPNVITTPHIAFFTNESVERMYRECITSIEQFLAGKEPDHMVKPL
ncbi:hydroxyacid dehydrogenase [Candidatus Peregrinibacteria bacterium CG10_big_fil_rev_8_21_14_0_10_49_16]|nr:MAG: hydroxyacid dehydrogenase [Candidatus Peregrinibacteria bacterium CG22_combo_CG10-13_8_21_14_all_49_11]PIR51771.1 MAG: hydroxyacid dehydrogenase [Candidatus Peregrinibacteria bacterium CG10_big_fil_rev_8_21_14_0_10_49_16]